jgi:hypothetical protein
MIVHMPSFETCSPDGAQRYRRDAAVIRPNFASLNPCTLADKAIVTSQDEMVKVPP